MSRVQGEEIFRRMFGAEAVRMKAGIRALEEKVVDSTDDVIWMTPAEFREALSYLSYETIYRQAVVPLNHARKAEEDGWVELQIYSGERRILRRYEP